MYICAISLRLKESWNCKDGKLQCGTLGGYRGYRGSDEICINGMYKLRVEIHFVINNSFMHTYMCKQKRILCFRNEIS
jgi:hypothetical protein